MDIPLTPSRPSVLLGAALRTLARPVLDLAPATGLSVLAARGFFDGVLPLLAPAHRARVERVRASHEGLDVRGEWVETEHTKTDRDGAVAADAEHPDPSAGVILYLHGGAFLCGSPRSHRGLVAELSARVGLPAFSVDYRLAPRHPHPAAAHDVRAAYGWLLDEGYRPERILVAGDSAGGHLALGLSVALRGEGMPLPAGLVLFSPLVDFSAETAAVMEAYRRDPYLSARLAKKMLPLYGRGDDAELELLRGDLSGLPPMLLQCGDAEMLSGDARALAAVVNSAGGDCRLEIWPGQMHVFQALYRLLPEAPGALDNAGDYARAVLAAATEASVISPGGAAPAGRSPRTAATLIDETAAIGPAGVGPTAPGWSGPDLPAAG